MARVLRASHQRREGFAMKRRAAQQGGRDGSCAHPCPAWLTIFAAARTSIGESRRIRRSPAWCAANEYHVRGELCGRTPGRRRRSTHVGPVRVWGRAGAVVPLKSLSIGHASRCDGPLPPAFQPPAGLSQSWPATSYPGCRCWVVVPSSRTSRISRVRLELPDDCSLLQACCRPAAGLLQQQRARVRQFMLPEVLVKRPPLPPHVVRGH
jgi:hypothetical protein